MSDMGKYIIRRLLTGVLVVLCVTVIIFGIMQAMPGNPIDLMVDTRVSAEKGSLILVWKDGGDFYAKLPKLWAA